MPRQDERGPCSVVMVKLNNKMMWEKRGGRVTVVPLVWIRVEDEVGLEPLIMFDFTQVAKGWG